MEKPVEILLVEDNQADVDLTTESFEDAEILNNVHVALDGVEALAFLRREGRYADVPRPDIVLLDLNLPKMSGREVIAEIKQDDDLKDIPVVILTSSEAETDVVKAYKLHANGYVTKHVDLERFVETMRAFENFWLKAVKLPSGRSGSPPSSSPNRKGMT